MRLPNGYGSIIKLGGKRRNPYAIRILTGYKLTEGANRSTPKYKYISYHRTRSEALDALSAYNRHRCDKIDYTLQQLYDEYKSVHFGKIARQTQDNYIAAWARFCEVKDYKVKNITVGQLQRIIDTATVDTKEGKKPAGTSTLSKIKALATQLWDYAMQNDIVDKNYAKFIELPKALKNEKECFTDIELAKIEQAAANGVPYADLILILCYTGWRISEFLQLTRFDYDAANKSFTGGMKTEAGTNRVVPVPAKVQPYVDAWLAKGGETVFCQPNGRPFKANGFRRDQYYPALDAIGVTRRSPHACRHTYATILHNAKVDSKEIQSLMGHANYNITATTYTHVDIKRLTEAVEKIG